MKPTVRSCAACEATWSQRGARWCAHCGARLVAASGGRSHRRSQLHRWSSAGAALLGLGAAAAIIATVGVGSGATDAFEAMRARPGAGEVELPPPTSTAPSEPDSGLLSLAYPPPDAPWLNADGSPWRGDVTLDPGSSTAATETHRPLDPVGLGEGDGWRIDLGSDAVAVVDTPDQVVVATEAGRLVALTADTGEPEWDTWLGSPIADLALIDDLVLVRLADGRATAVQVTDGRQRWEYQPAGVVDRVRSIGQTDGTALAVTATLERPRMTAWSPDDGHSLWDQPLTRKWLTGPDGVLAAPVGVVDGRLVGFDPATGERAWELALNPGEDLVESVGDMALLTGRHGFRWIDLASGEVRFLSSPSLGSWLALPDDALLLGGSGSQGILLAVEADGQERWRQPLPGGVGGCCVDLDLVGGDRVLATDRRTSSTIVVLDLADGSIRADLSPLEAATDRRVLGVTSRVAVVAGTSGAIGFDLETLTPQWRTSEDLEVLASAPRLLLRTRTLGTDTDAAPGLVVPG